MSPQLVDFNADGDQDLVMGTFEGVVFVVPGSEAGYLEPERVLDKQGRTILISQFWNHDEEKWDSADRSPEGEHYPEDHQISAVAVDWDDDGDLDLLLGAKEGRLYLRRNEGTKGKPSFAPVNEQILAGDEEFEVPGGLTAPRLVDWNGDGLFDLLCPSFKGGVYLYENVGKRGAPAFEDPRTLIPKPEGGKKLSTFPARPTRGLYADAVDYDEDGDLDLLVGGYAKYKPEAPELTEEQEIELAELQAEDAKLQEALSEALKKYSAEDEGSLAEYSRLHHAKEDLAKRIQVLAPREVEEAFVWLYRRQ